MIKLFDSLSGKKTEFKPINSEIVKMYACGITVYDKMHIGHARTTIFIDILYRLLKEIYKNVIFVRNITDVDDKINKKATERNITIQELTEEVIKYCDFDMEYLNNLTPIYEPKATKHIPEIIVIIEKLLKNGNAYVSNNHVLFDVNSYKEYGRLSKKNLEELIEGNRIEVADYKKNSMDFVLWKPSLEIDDESSKFNSPWGIGRPGWHIECSAMSHKYLGEHFDIHCGGVDLKFPHHENEIAQSCCAFHTNFVNYWFHIGSLMVDGEKMSKSLGNFLTIEDIRNKNISGTTIRFMMLKNHYRKPFDFKESLLEESRKKLINLHKNLTKEEIDYKIPQEVIEILSDDLNTVEVVALMNQFNKNKEFEKLKNSMLFLGIFDINLLNEVNNAELKIEVKEIELLIKERQLAKDNKNWEKADEIRKLLKDSGVILNDNSNGTSWEIEKKI